MIRYFFFKADIREPYMGNTLIVGVRVETDCEDPESFDQDLTIITSGDGIKQLMRRITPDEFNELFND